MDLDEAYRILETDEKIGTLEQLTRIKDDLVAAWQPERFANDPGFQQKSREKLEKIEIAYQRLADELSENHGGIAPTTGRDTPLSSSDLTTDASVPPPPPQWQLEAAHSRRAARIATARRRRNKIAATLGVVVVVVIGALVSVGKAIFSGSDGSQSNTAVLKASATPAIAATPSSKQADYVIQQSIPVAQGSHLPTQPNTSNNAGEVLRAEAVARPSLTPAIDMAILPGERFPQTRQRQLATAEIQSWTPEQLRYAINEMYARHGAEFLEPQLKSWFSQFGWYKPIASNTYERTQTFFTPLEVENLKMLGQARLASSSSATPDSRRDARLIHAPQPTYRYEARKTHAIGSGQFEIAFDSTGRAVAVKIVRSTNNRILDANTINTLRSWRASPGVAWKTVADL